MSIKEKTHDHTNDTNLLVEMWCPLKLPRDSKLS